MWKAYLESDEWEKHRWGGKINKANDGWKRYKIDTTQVGSFTPKL